MKECKGRRKIEHGGRSPIVSKAVLWERETGPEKALKVASDN